MKKTALLTITGLFPFVVFSQPLDLLNNFLNETKQASGAFEQQTFQKDGKPAEELQNVLVFSARKICLDLYQPVSSEDGLRRQPNLYLG